MQTNFKEGIDILMNNAGVFEDTESPVEIVKEDMKVNFYGTVSLTESVLPLMKKNGKIITIGAK
jgi:carbonyl reductase 1/carbonyl reductase 3